MALADLLPDHSTPSGATTGTDADRIARPSSSSRRSADTTGDLAPPARSSKRLVVAIASLAAIAAVVAIVVATRSSSSKASNDPGSANRPDDLLARGSDDGSARPANGSSAGDSTRSDNGSQQATGSARSDDHAHPADGSAGSDDGSTDDGSARSDDGSQKNAGSQQPADGSNDPARQPAQDDPVAKILARADAHLARRWRDGAIDVLVKARRTYPKDARLPYRAGLLYLEKLWWPDGLKQLRAAIALDPSLRTDPALIRAAIRAFTATAHYDWQLAGFLRKDIGVAARPYLEATAKQDKNPVVRNRAKAELARLK